MDILTHIQNNFEKYKISEVQLDPNGVCNAKCWFCPVKYQGNPPEGRDSMSPDLLEKIIANIIQERDKENGLVYKTFRGIWTANYNEILLYKHLEEMLKICKKYDLFISILSNGLNLTPEKTDLIKKYEDQVCGFSLNIPGFEPEIWSKRSGFNINLFPKLINNLNYAYEHFEKKVSEGNLSIIINGVNENSFVGNGGIIKKGEQFPNDIDLNAKDGELEKQYQIAIKMFPKIPHHKISKNSSIIDRVGHLRSVISNQEHLNNSYNSKNRRVIGCSNRPNLNLNLQKNGPAPNAGREYSHLHINAVADVFLCCNDYNFEYKIGNLKNQSLSDFWGKTEHINIIKKAYENICSNCTAAIHE